MMFWVSDVVAIVNGCNPFLAKDRWFESSLAHFFIKTFSRSIKDLANVAELVYAVVLGAMSFGLQVRVLSLVEITSLYGNITQLARVSPLQGGSRWFDSDCFHLFFIFLHFLLLWREALKSKKIKFDEKLFFL
jgi:hypothetical protein